MSIDHDLRAWVAELLGAWPAATGKLSLVETSSTATVYKLATPTDSYALKIGGLAQRSEVAAYRLLSVAAPANVPRLIGSVATVKDQWLCLEWIEGTTFAQAPSEHCAVQAAEQLALTQGKLMAEFAENRSLLPERDPTTWLYLLDRAEAYLTAWFPRAAVDYGRFMPSGAAPLPANLLKQLTDNQPRIEALITALASVPNSIDHGDLHAHNFGLRSDGHVFLLDWADAAWSPPFVSLEFLLRVARNVLGEHTADRVRRAYIDALPFGSIDERERLLTQARGLAPLNFASAVIRREKESSEPQGTSAWIVARALHQVIRSLDPME